MVFKELLKKFGPIVSLLVLVPATALALDGKLNSFCSRSGSPEKIIWTLDSVSASKLRVAVPEIDISQRELLDHMDSILQSIAVEGRPLMHQRMRNSLGTSCNRGAHGCIFFETGSAGGCKADGTVRANAGCFAGACQMTVCLNGIASNPNQTQRMRRLTRTIKHEFGHIFGANHVDDDALVCTAASTSPRSPCFGGQTDGSDGELMTSSTSCARSTHLQSSDGAGFRTHFNDESAYGEDESFFKGRDLFTGGRGTSVDDLDQLGSRTSIFRPRVDCASNSFPEWSCVILQVYESGNNPDTSMTTKIVGLNNANPQGEWGIHSSRFTHVQDTTFGGDVAISPNGEKAFLVYAAKLSNNTYVRAVDLSTTNSEPIKSLGYKSVYPPRISINTSTNTIIVIGYETSADGNLRYSVNFTPVIHMGPADDLSALTRQTNTGVPMRDITPHFSWDFDCSDTTSRCAVVGVHDVSEEILTFTTRLGRFRSTSFEVSTQHTISSVEYSLNSTPSNHTRITGVVGVDLRGSNDRLAISASRRISGTSSGNTLIAHYNDAEAVPSELVSFDIVKNNPPGCATTYYDGLAVASGMSTWGGYDITFGAVLGGNLRDYVTAHLGRRDDPQPYIYFCH